MDDFMKFMPIFHDIFFDCEDEYEENLVLFLSEAIKSKKEKQKRVCIKNYVEEVVPLYSDSDFKSHFRVSRSTFEILVQKFEEMKARSHVGRPAIRTEKQLLSVLWLLANQETFRSVADRFDLPKSGLHNHLKSVCRTLTEMAPSVISWPRVREVKEEFYSICGFPDIVGAIDGSHIKIKAPTEHPEKYYNRKGDYSIILQGICSPSLIFSHVFCSFPGAVHDARVLRNSEVFNIMFNNREYFPNNEHLVGDNAYPLHVNLMVPFKDNGHLPSRQTNFNKKLSKSRVCVERAFGQLKGRFRRLKFFDVGRVDMLPLYVLASCVLHNICIKNDDFVDEAVDESDDDDDLSDDSINISIVAVNKRDYICGILQ